MAEKAKIAQEQEKKKAEMEELQRKRVESEAEKKILDAAKEALKVTQLARFGNSVNFVVVVVFIHPRS